MIANIGPFAQYTKGLNQQMRLIFSMTAAVTEKIGAVEITEPKTRQLGFMLFSPTGKLWVKLLGYLPFLCEIQATWHKGVSILLLGSDIHFKRSITVA